VDWGSFPPEQLAVLWLKGLPLGADEKEAKLAHRQLCSMIETGDTSILGGGYCNMPEIFRVFAAVLASCKSDSSVMSPGVQSSTLAHPETMGRIQYIVKMLATSVPQAVIQDAFGKLDDNKQKTLSAIMA
jgi:hypothetical protein